ncbi:MAG: hypothetical protein ONB46_02930 [candidate division KSB1 bacterium]|nr:hypothetical protein [candidate division KSB1 bacterium]MDZ7364810.1 hypothetical protein [candidate division KSB1 bacterium]MDZ7402913.1 hypothetical protein [candidate division KSB1 bacterium]
MRIATSLLFILISLSACTTARHAGDEVEPKTLVRVENRNFLDMKIYILRGAERIRIGTVTGNSTQVLVIPQYLVVNAGLIRFLADPIGGSQTPISQEISVRPGQEVELIITN